jgi:hypothetical protein
MFDFTLELLYNIISNDIYVKTRIALSGTLLQSTTGLYNTGMDSLPLLY